MNKEFVEVFEVLEKAYGAKLKNYKNVKKGQDMSLENYLGKKIKVKIAAISSKQINTKVGMKGKYNLTTEKNMAFESWVGPWNEAWKPGDVVEGVLGSWDGRNGKTYQLEDPARSSPKTTPKPTSDVDSEKLFSQMLVNQSKTEECIELLKEIKISLSAGNSN